MVYEIGSLSQLKERAKEIAPFLKPPLSCGFIGELGAGKTTLIREIVAALGYSGDVNSPTYVLSHEYHIPARELLIEHWDLYRVKDCPEELYESAKGNLIRLIEWPDRVPEVLQSLEQVYKIELFLDPREDRYLRKLTIS